MDPLWHAVYTALRPLLKDDDVVVVPKGDWPAFPCAAVFYVNLIELNDCTVLVLHKGLLTVLPQAELHRVAEQWQWIFANEIFVVLSRSQRVKRDVRRTGDLIHCRPLMRFLSSASLRRRRSKIIYIHLPKTGGTSMWASLTRAFPSHVYYPSLHAYLNNPPARDDYDLVGLHCSPSIALPSLCEDDWMIGMMRHPTQRQTRIQRPSLRRQKQCGTCVLPIISRRIWAVRKHVYSCEPSELVANIRSIRLPMRSCCTRLLLSLDGTMSSSRHPNAPASLGTLWRIDCAAGPEHWGG
jgi:hypothetical protein